MEISRYVVTSRNGERRRERVGRGAGGRTGGVGRGELQIVAER